VCMGRGRRVQASPRVYRLGPQHEDPRLCSHYERPQSGHVPKPWTGGDGDKGQWSCLRIALRRGGTP
jgi:hypothetical protein